MAAPTVTKLGHLNPTKLEHVSIYDPDHHLPHPDPEKSGAYCCTAGTGENRCKNIRLLDAMVDKKKTNAAYLYRNQVDTYLPHILDKNAFAHGMMLYFMLDDWVVSNLCKLHCNRELLRNIVEEKLHEITHRVQETGMFEEQMVVSRVGEGIYAITNPAFGKYDANVKETGNANALVVYQGPYAYTNLTFGKGVKGTDVMAPQNKTTRQAPNASQLKNISIFAADYHLPHPEESGTYRCTTGIGDDRCVNIRSLDADKTRGGYWRRKQIDSFLPQILEKNSLDLGVLLYSKLDELVYANLCVEHLADHLRTAIVDEKMDELEHRHRLQEIVEKEESDAGEERPNANGEEPQAGRFRNWMARWVGTARS